MERIAIENNLENLGSFLLGHAAADEGPLPLSETLAQLIEQADSTLSGISIRILPRNEASKEQEVDMTRRGDVYYTKFFTDELGNEYELVLAAKPNYHLPAGYRVWRLLIIGIYLLGVWYILFRRVDLPKHKQFQPTTAEPAKHSLERQALISGIAAGTIHEIRSPLTAARGFVQLLATLMPENELTHKYSEYALLEMDRIEQLLQEYMLLSEAVVPESVPLNLLDIAHNSYLLMEGVMSQKQIRFQFEGKQPACILGDALYLQHALQHLLYNAAEATPPNGYVRVTVDTTETTVILTISDTGTGIEPEVLEHCFDPFYSTKPSGIGLGLAICQRIVTHMQGTIDITSQVGQGTTVRMIFPRVANCSQE